MSFSSSASMLNVKSGISLTSFWYIKNKEIRQRALHAETKCTMNSQIKLYGYFQRTMQERPDRAYTAYSNNSIHTRKNNSLGVVIQYSDCN
jgi:hypothetical protein